MAFVSDIPEPPEPLRADFYAELRHDLLHITHAGGSELSSVDVLITVTADGISSTFQLSEGMFTHGGSSSTWMQGDEWVLDLTAHKDRFRNTDVTFIPASLKMTISHLTLPEPLWSKTLKSDEPQPAKLKSFEVLDSDGNPNQMKDVNDRRIWVIFSGEGFKIRVEVETPSQVTVQLVRADLGSLYGGSRMVTLSGIGGGVYRFSSESPPTSANGWHSIRLIIDDSAGNKIQETRSILLRDKSSEGEIPPIEPEDPPEDEVLIDPGIGNPAIVNDLYFLTPAQWSSFVDSGGLAVVHDTFAISGDQIVMAFKNGAVQGLEASKVWGGTVKGCPHLFITVYNAYATVSAGVQIGDQIAAGTNVQRHTINNMAWNSYVFTLEDAHLAALNTKGLFIKFEIKFTSNGNGEFEATARADAYANFYRPENEATKVYTHNPGGQPKGVLEIGEDIIISVKLPDVASLPASNFGPKFWLSSFHKPSRIEVKTEYLGLVGTTLSFRLDSYEAVSVYMSDSSLFIFCEAMGLVVGPYQYYKIAAKLYLTEDHVVESGGNIQDTINAADPGDSIRVFGGNYGQTLYINKPLIIYGNGTTVPPTKIDAASSGVLVKIEDTEDVDFRGFVLGSQSKISLGVYNSKARIEKIQTGGSGNTDGVAIEIRNSPGTVLSDSKLYGPNRLKHQVSVQESPGTVIHNVTITPVTSAEGVSVEIRNSAGSQFRNSNMTADADSSARHHLSIQNSPETIVSGVTFRNTQLSDSVTVEIRDSAGSQFFSNTLNYGLKNGQKVKHQLSIQGSERTLVQNNKIQSVQSAGAVTVDMQNSARVDFSDNTIDKPSGKAAGQIHVYNCEGIVMRGNIIASLQLSSEDVSTSRGITVEIVLSDRVDFSLNKLPGSGNGARIQLRVNDCREAVIRANVINSLSSNQDVTVEISNSHRTDFSDNTIDGKPTTSIKCQLHILNSKEVTFTYNSFEPKPGAQKYTIILENSPNCRHDGNGFPTSTVNPEGYIERINSP